MTPSAAALGSGSAGSRVARLRHRLGELFSTEAMLVSNPANIRYLSGFIGASTGLLVLPDRLVLFTDGRYRQQALSTLCAPHLSHNGGEVAANATRSETIREALPATRRLVVEADQLSWAEHRRLAADLAGIELVATEDVVLADRLVKDAGELARMSAAAGISDAAFEDLVASEPIGWTEREIASFLLERFKELGAERAAFEMIATTAARTAVPHLLPGTQRLEEGELLLVDFGAEIDGYKADMTRTIWWGQLRSELEPLVVAVREAFQAAVAALAVGVPYPAVDSAARGALKRHGLEEYVVHPSGHNLGLEIHERPYFGSHYDAVVAAGNVVTIEPGVYLPDVGGVRIEDTFVVTETGPVALTRSAHGGPNERRRAADPRAAPAGSDPGDPVELDEHARFIGDAKGRGA